MEIAPGQRLIDLGVLQYYCNQHGSCYFFATIATRDIPAVQWDSCREERGCYNNCANEITRLYASHDNAMNLVFDTNNTVFTAVPTGESTAVSAQAITEVLSILDPAMAEEWVDWLAPGGAQDVQLNVFDVRLSLFVH